MTSPAAGDAPERRLREVWRELTRRGFAMDQPRAGTCMCFIWGLRRAHCAVDLLAGGALVWEFIPLPGTIIPGQVARMVWALLGGGAGPARCGQPPAMPAGVLVGEVVLPVIQGERGGVIAGERG